MGITYFSYSTLFFYYLMAIILSLMIYDIKDTRVRISKIDNNIKYFVLFLILLAFAVCRKVAPGIGGTDAIMYEKGFFYALSGHSRFDDTDILFGYFNKLVRFFTDSPLIFRLICYSLIAGSYVLFIKYLCPKGVSCIPFLILIWPYIKSFNTMRCSMAIGIFLIGLILLFKNKRKWAYLIILSSFFVHRMSLIFIPIIPFLLIFKNKIINLNGKQILIYSVILIALGCLSARILQSYIISAALFEDNGTADSYYIQMSMGRGILSNWPMMFPTFLLLIALGLFNNKLPHTPVVQYIKILVIYNIIILPAAIILGMWRASEYLYIAEVVMWGILINVICQLTDNTGKVIIRLIFIMAFLFLLHIRFTHEWEECQIMPYLFYWQ